MKTYFADFLPKIQRFSKKIDDFSLLVNQHWVVIEDIVNVKKVYIFRSNNELLISENGNVEKGKWEHLQQGRLLLEINQKNFLFRNVFFDENFLALAVDGRDEYAVMINESKWDDDINTIDKVAEFLNQKYAQPSIRDKIVNFSGNQINPAKKNLSQPNVAKTTGVPQVKTDMLSGTDSRGISAEDFSPEIKSLIEQKQVLADFMEKGLLTDTEYAGKLALVEQKIKEQKELERRSKFQNKARWIEQRHEEIYAKTMQQIEPLVAKLRILLDAGLITEDEFNSKKDLLFSKARSEFLKCICEVIPFNQLKYSDKQAIKRHYALFKEQDKILFNMHEKTLHIINDEEYENLIYNDTITNFRSVEIPDWLKEKYK